jgi:GntR family transcriptional regulator
VAKAYCDLEHEGVIELRQGAGAFVAGNGRARRVTRITGARPVLQAAMDHLAAAGLTVDEIRRLVEAELLRLAEKPRTRK